MTIFSGPVVVSDSTPTLLQPGVDADRAWEIHVTGASGMVVGDSTVTHSGYSIPGSSEIFRVHGPLYGLFPAGGGSGTVHVLALGQ